MQDEIIKYSGKHQSFDKDRNEIPVSKEMADYMDKILEYSMRKSTENIKNMPKKKK